MQTSDPRDPIASALVEFAWSQWVQLGVSGEITRFDDWAIDPEALFLLTLEVGQEDPRLFDEALDWMARNGRHITLPRLRNLARSWSVTSGLVDASLEWAGQQNGLRQWKAQELSRRPSSPRRLFPANVAGYVAEPDPLFLEFGFVRPRLNRSWKSQEPSLQQASAFALRLRALFGTGSRPEVVRFLLTGSGAPASAVSAARVAEAVGYTKRVVQFVLVSLAESGTVKARWRANKRAFNVFPSQWEGLLGAFPVWMEWIPLLRALTRLARWARESRGQPLSAHMTASRVRSLADEIQADLASAGFSLPDPRIHPGPAYVGAFWGALSDILVALRMPDAAGALREASAAQA